MRTLVMKFGGSAVGMTTGLTQVLSIVLYEHERWDRLLIVVSALEGVTDALIEAAHLAELNSRRGYRRIVATLRTRHLALIEHLPLGATERAALQADVDRLLFDMLDLCQTLAENKLDDQRRPEVIDAITGMGERLAARIVAALLRQNNVRSVAIDATDIIITDNVYGNATPNIDLTRERIARLLTPMLERQIIPVLTGFIGSTVSGKPTTLGRGGSDYTASILALCTDAQEVWIWTDVDGMMTADPRDIPNARVIPNLTYDEVGELAYFGARILHARMIGPLREGRIPLRVRNVFRPQGMGTRIDQTGRAGSPAVKAVTSIQGLGMAIMRSGSYADIAALVDEELFEITGTRAEVVIASQSSTRTYVCFVIPTSAGPDAVHSLQIALENHLTKTGEGWTMRPASIITAIGAGIGNMPQVASRMFAALGEIKVLAVDYGSGSDSLSFVVDPAETERAMQRLHALILEYFDAQSPNA